MRQQYAFVSARSLAWSALLMALLGALPVLGFVLAWSLGWGRNQSGRELAILFSMLFGLLTVCSLIGLMFAVLARLRGARTRLAVSALILNLIGLAFVVASYL